MLMPEALLVDLEADMSNLVMMRLFDWTYCCLAVLVGRV